MSKMNRRLAIGMLVVLVLVVALSACGASTEPVPTLKPPDADYPAAGICADPPEGELVTIAITPGVPDPRCVRARPDQKLQVVNATEQPAQVRLAEFDATLNPGERQVFDKPFGEYLAPGVHFVSISTLGNAALWLLE